MGQRSHINDAVLKDAQIKFREEECVRSMGQRSNYAAVKDAQIKRNTEESASSMGQSSNFVARKDAQIKPPKHRWKDGQIK